MQGAAARDWLLIDGECGFCRRVGAWVERHDKAGRFRVIPWQEAPSPPLDDELRRAARDTVLVVRPDGRVLRGGRASLHVLEQVGHPVLARAGRLPGVKSAVEGGYRLVARHRGLFSRVFFRPPRERSA